MSSWTPAPSKSIAGTSAPRPTRSARASCCIGSAGTTAGGARAGARPGEEDRRQLHRGLKDLQRQQTECSNRIKGLLASQGLDTPVDASFRTTLAQLRDWAGRPVPAGLQQRLLQEFAVWEALHRQ